MESIKRLAIVFLLAFPVLRVAALSSESAAGDKLNVCTVLLEKLDAQGQSSDVEYAVVTPNNRKANLRMGPVKLLITLHCSVIDDLEVQALISGIFAKQICVDACSPEKACLMGLTDSAGGSYQVIVMPGINDTPVGLRITTRNEAAANIALTQ